MARVFSGIQPSGVPTLGNYLGAIRNWVPMQDPDECLFCVVDLHAITQRQEPAELLRQTREMAAALIACGLSPDKCVLFVQSHVPAHAQLAWVFNCIARLGWLNRMTQFKDKAGKDREAASTGLYVYPTLMAADILVYHATQVPVGDDQRQHLELANDIAEIFNHDYGVEFCPRIEPHDLEQVFHKMSKRPCTLLDHHRLRRVIEQGRSSNEAGNRRAQLVRDIGRETSLTLGCLIEFSDRRTKGFRHIVERATKLSDLIAPARMQTRIEVASSQAARQPDFDLGTGCQGQDHQQDLGEQI
jgi:hypothetical protein